MPLQPRQLASSALQASPGKHVSMVEQSCQQHIPAGAAVVVVVGGVHNSSQCATHAAKTEGLVGQSLIHACSDPPGQPPGTGAGAGAGVVGVGAGAGAGVVVAGQSSLH